MADNYTDNRLFEELSLEDDLARIEQEQLAISALVDDLKKDADSLVKYPLERLRANIGRWLVPKKNTLDAHYAMVKNRALDIDFSPANYPGFDQIFTEKYAGKGFFDPEHENFPRYEPLRDNLATVRNYILTQYFPENGVPDPKRSAQLKEIAEFLAEGLSNDKVYFGFIVSHNPFKPFIDVKLAKAPNGEGARYLYAKILEMQRQNNWNRPFDKVTELFGGTATGGWGLPKLEDSIFSLDAPEIDNDADHKDVGQRIGALAALFDALEEKRAALRERFALRNHAQDLNALANQMFDTFYTMKEGVDALAQPIRREAVDIAHDILNKLKIRLSSTEAEMVTQFPSNEDTDALSSISGVGRVIQRMSSYLMAAGQNAMSIPAVAAAHQALGQIAYMAKMNAYNAALIAGDGKLVATISSQLSELKSHGFGGTSASLGSLVNKLQQGVEALSSRSNGASIVGAEVAPPAQVGTGTVSQQQALTQLRLLQNQQQQKSSQINQRNQSQVQQQHAQQDILHAQQAMAQVQQAQHQAHQHAHPQAQESVFKPTISNKSAVNGNVARQNAKNARKMVQAEIEKALITPATPKASAPLLKPQPITAAVSPAVAIKPAMHIDPSLVAGLGNSLNKAQLSASALKTDIVGPKSTRDAIHQAKNTSDTQHKEAEAMLEMDRANNLKLQRERELNSPLGSGRGR